MDEHVAGAESPGDLTHGLRVAEIDRELALAVEDRHVMSGGGQRADYGATDSAGATGYDRRSIHVSSAPRGVPA
jgi:hypothetical protein